MYSKHDLNRTCNFLGQRDNETSSKYWQGMRRAGTAVKIHDGTVPDFDSLSLPVPRERAEKDVLKQERMVLSRKIMFLNWKSGHFFLKLFQCNLINRNSFCLGNIVP